MTSFHLIPMWHEWNANATVIMVTWFTLYANRVTSHLACAMHTCMHGPCPLCKTSASKYLSGLVCMQANTNLAKITTSHFWVLNTQNANRNMPNRILIAYHHKNFTNCNENLAWVNKNPLFIPTCLGTKQKVRKWQKLPSTFISCSNHNF